MRLFPVTAPDGSVGYLDVSIVANVCPAVDQGTNQRILNACVVMQRGCMPLVVKGDVREVAAAIEHAANIPAGALPSLGERFSINPVPLTPRTN